MSEVMTEAAPLLYRIEERDGGFEPQMLYNAGAVPGDFWFPLNADGYWADPDAFSFGLISKRSPLPTRAGAHLAILRAKAINEPPM